ncbi:MAG: alpha/beta hydrolase domain-containing protein [Myxococcales bacterium]
MVTALLLAIACPSDLSQWRQLLGAEWIDCHAVADLTTTNNPYTDPQSLTGMGFPPPGSGTLNSKYSTPTAPPVSGIQIDGYWPDACDAFQAEPALTAKDGTPFIPGCTPPPAVGQTCFAGCHHDAQFVIRVPDDWDGHLLTAGTPGIRDAFASDFILSDYALERGWAYVSQDKGNMGANFYWQGVGGASWSPGAAVQEWTSRMRQATSAAKALLSTLGTVTRSYAAGISNGGYQTRRAIEADGNGQQRLYDGGMDWEGTLFSTRETLFSYLPTSLAQYPGDVLGVQSSVDALAAVGFNPQSQPLWAYRWGIYWGLTQKIYRLEFDPEYTNYTCSGIGPACISPPAEVVQPDDVDAAYDFSLRLAQNPALASRLAAVANTGDLQHPMITVHGDQDSLLPIKTDSDLYAQLVAQQHRSQRYRYYVVQGGNHVDPQYDDHAGVDSYGDTVLRPILPCARAALDALALWVEQGIAPPPSHTIARPQGATPDQLANQCSLQ